MLLFALGLFGSGCSTVQRAEFKPPPASIQKHAIRVALVLEKGLCQLEQRRDPEGYVYPLGGYLCPCARHIAQEAFAKVTEYDSLDTALKCRDADAVLVPKFVKLEIRARGVAWEKRHTLVVLEWSLKNIKDQKTLWLATVEGRAEGNVGTMFSMNKNDRVAMQQAMDDLTRKSVEAFNKSEEIKAFARTPAGL
ncbi:MAG: hypothetical protein L0Z50_12705 [Verrucomicrobiales bacterium]|nr:hypothetical protein [Verrucomicrobiales bacterium]